MLGQAIVSFVLISHLLVFMALDVYATQWKYHESIKHPAQRDRGFFLSFGTVKILVVPTALLFNTDSLSYQMAMVLLFLFCSGIFTLYLGSRLAGIQDAQSKTDSSEEE